MEKIRIVVVDDSAFMRKAISDMIESEDSFEVVAKLRDGRELIEKVEDKGVPVICCGEVMKELQAGIEDAAFEKHIPVYTVEGDTVHVFVGEVEHPMTAEHWIEWVSLKTDKGIQRKYLKPGEKPSVDFKILEGEEVEEVYAYCNLHGLWKK